MKSKRVKLLLTISEMIYSSQLRNLYDLISLIDRSVFDMEVGALATGDDAQKEIESLDVPIYRLRLQPSRGAVTRQIVDMAKGPLIIARKRYDIVHSLLYQSLFTEPLFFKALTPTKYIYTKSNLEWDNHPWNWNIKCKLADRVISISNATDALLDQKGYGKKKAKIFLGIDTGHFVRSDAKRAHLREQLGLSPGSMVFGCAAQFVEWKEHLTALRAFESIASGRDDAYLVYCGANHRDEYYDKFQSAVNASQYKDRIRVLGNLSDMPAFYSLIDCFVLPSRYETFGYVYVEAMSSGVPVIGCRAAGPLEIIDDGVTGRLVNISDADDLASKMSEYLIHPELIEAEGRAARRRATEIFSKETMAEKSQQLYLDTLSKQKA